MRYERPRSRKRPSGPKGPTGVSRLLDEAGALYSAGRPDAAATVYARAERADPADFRAAYSLAVIDLGRGRAAPAIARLKRVIAKQPALFEAQHNLGSACQTLARWDEAAAAYERALALRPDALETRKSLAVVLAILGRADAAAAQHRQLAADPATRLWALTRLALLRPAAIEAADLAAMRAGAADAALDVEVRAGLGFALGEALEAQGRTEEAFAAFDAGNRLKRAALERDPATAPAAVLAAHIAAAERTAQRFTPPLLAAQAGRGLAEPRPIFIVGMPRSGSTLIEQILASHPALQALGETGALPRRLEAGDLMTGDAPDLRALAKDYLKGLRRAGWRETLRPVDKTLENYLHVGAIALMFPRAVILHAARDPIDTCLSCWRQLFAEGGESLYDLRDIGAEYVGYRRLMQHWTDVLPGRVTLIRHEALVADPETEIRRLVTEVCGLAWDPACLAFHETPGPVLTASATQVRSPIFTTSLARWRRYEAHLGPLIEALGPYAEPAPSPLVR